MRSRGLIAAVGALALIASCKKTVEGESKAWTRGLERVQSLATLYPGFASALQAQRTNAEAAMKAAEGVSNAEEKAKKMSEANDMLTGAFVGTLESLDGKIKRVRDKIVTANSSTMDPNDRMAARAASNEAERVLGESAERLRAGAGDPASALTIVRKVDGDLSSATSTLDRIIDAAKKKQEAQKATATAGAGTAGAAGAAVPVKAPPWKCKYCQHANNDERKKCENCGAPRP